MGFRMWNSEVRFVMVKECPLPDGRGEEGGAESSEVVGGWSQVWMSRG